LYVFSRDKGWPSFCRILGWIVSVIVILGGAFVVFSYGLQFGNDKTYQWVVSMIFAFFSSVIIIQPLKVIERFKGNITLISIKHQ